MYSNSTISLDDSLRQKINLLLRKETPYDSIIERIEGGTNEVLQNDVKYKMKGNMLMAHHKDQNEESQYWRVVLPDDSEIRKLVITELHSIPFMAHPGISRTVSKARDSFLLEGYGRRYQILRGSMPCMPTGEDRSYTVKGTVPSPRRHQRLNGKMLVWTLLQIYLGHKMGILAY